LSYGTDFVFQQDRAPTHTVHITMNSVINC